MISLNEKTVQNMYFFLNLDWSDALNNRYVYIDKKTMIYLIAGRNKVNSLKIPATNYTCFEYEKKRYLKANKATV